MADPSPLHARLEELHRQLGRAESIDEEAQALLRALLDDISRLLAPGADRPTPPDEAESLDQRVQKLALQFEAEHPLLAAALNQLTDSLAKMGI